MSATTILDSIVAKHRAEFESQCAHMQTTGFLGRIALAQKVADLLVADGFRIWTQVCWTSVTTDSSPPSIYLHIKINMDHWQEGLRRISEILPLLRPLENIYTEDGHTININPVIERFFDGWKPAELREAAVEIDHAQEGGAA